MQCEQETGNEVWLWERNFLTPYERLRGIDHEFTELARIRDAISPIPLNLKITKRYTTNLEIMQEMGA